MARLLAPAIGIALFAVFAILHSVDHPLYMSILAAYGVGPMADPFLDASGTLAAVDCARAGLDVFAANPCDVYGRVHDYSPIWLELKYLPVTAHMVVPICVTIDLLFLLSLCSLPPPKSWREQAVRIAATVSPISVYALERANVDVILFLLVLGGGLFLSRSGRVRLWGYGLLLFAAVLKYYPLVTLAVALRERRAQLLAITAVSIGVVGVFLACTYTDTLRSLAVIARAGYFADSFSSMNLPRGIAEILTHSSAHPILSASAEIYVVVALYIVLVLNTLTVSVGYARQLAADRKEEKPLSTNGLMQLLLGALIMFGCFTLWQNVYYRGIYLLLILPGLFLVGRDKGAGRAALDSGVALILIVMWSEPLRQLLAHLGEYGRGPRQVWRDAAATVWVLREFVWWRITALLAAILISRTWLPAWLAHRIALASEQ